MMGRLYTTLVVNEERRNQILFVLMILLVLGAFVVGPSAVKPVYFVGGIGAVVVLFLLSLDLEACVLGFALLLPCVPRSFYTPKFFFPVGIDLIRGYLPFMFLALFIRWLMRKRITIIHHPAQKWMVLWIIMYAAAFPRSLDIRESILWGIVPTLAAVMAYWLFIVYARDLRHVKRLLSIIILASGVVVFFACLEAALGRSLFWSETQTREGHMRAASTLENAQVLGSFLLICVPIVGLYYHQARGFVRRMFWILVLGLYVVTIVLTLTRSAWLGTIMIGCLLVKNKKSFVVLILLGILFYLSPLFAEYVAPTLKSHLATGNVYHRLYVFKKAFYITKDHPFLGIGLRNFVPYSLEYDIEFIGTKRYLHNPGSHNTYFTYMTELGVFGIMGFLAMIWLSLKSVWKLYRNHDKYGEIGVYGRIIFISLMALLITGLTYQAFQWGTLITPLLLLLGACQVIDRLAKEQEKKVLLADDGSAPDE